MVWGKSFVVSATMIESLDEAMSSSAVSNFNSEPKLYTVTIKMKMPNIPGMIIFDK